jgi:SAM-dependent methyltransferase
MGMGDLRQEYFDSQARVWDTQTPTQKQETVRHIFSELIPQISIPVLDVGSGTGILQPILIERMDYHPQIIELDIAVGMLQQAKLKTLNTSGIQYINGDVHFLPFADHSIASAICFESVPHFRDKPKAFRELHRGSGISGLSSFTRTDGAIIIPEPIYPIAGNRKRKSLSDPGTKKPALTINRLLAILFFAYSSGDKHERQKKDPDDR